MRLKAILVAATSCGLMAMVAEGHAQTPAPAAPATAAAAAPDPLRAYIPTTISPQAAALYRAYRPLLLSAGPKIATTTAEFDANYKTGEEHAITVDAPYVKAMGLTIIERQISGVKVLEIRPKDYQDDGTVLIHVHGGGFIYGSPRSSLRSSGAMVAATGKRVISVDYTVAPRGQFQLVTDQVVAVYKALLAEGIKPSKIGLFGESAGGNIVAGSALKLRDQGLPLPAGLILVSPATDLTGAGDTRVTLAEAEPVLRPVGAIQPGIDAYVAPADQKNPYASPVYGDFTKGYPPTLIQGGTKEILLSDMVRLHRAIRAAGGDSRLEIYEGMPHGFPSLMVGVGAQEGKEAMAESAAFWRLHMAKN